jgi:hypothetical protein
VGARHGAKFLRPADAGEAQEVANGVFVGAAGAWVAEIAEPLDELCGKVGDGVNQAADLISVTASIPSLNFIPLTTFGNWF